MQNNNPRLLKLQKRLDKFFTYFKDDDVLVISEDKTTLPFCYAIVDSSHPRHILLSIAVDYPTSMNVCEIALLASKIAPAAITHPFYISTTSGTTHIDDDAYTMWDIDAIDMELLVPITDAIN